MTAGRFHDSHPPEKPRGEFRLLSDSADENREREDLVPIYREGVRRPGEVDIQANGKTRKTAKSQSVWLTAQRSTEPVRRYKNPQKTPQTAAAEISIGFPEPT